MTKWRTLIVAASAAAALAIGLGAQAGASHDPDLQAFLRIPHAGDPS